MFSDSFFVKTADVTEVREQFTAPNRLTGCFQSCMMMYSSDVLSVPTLYLSALVGVYVIDVI